MRLRIEPSLSIHKHSININLPVLLYYVKHLHPNPWSGPGFYDAYHFSILDLNYWLKVWLLQIRFVYIFLLIYNKGGNQIRITFRIKKNGVTGLCTFYMFISVRNVLFSEITCTFQGHHKKTLQYFSPLSWRFKAGCQKDAGYTDSPLKFFLIHFGVCLYWNLSCMLRFFYFRSASWSCRRSREGRRRMTSWGRSLLNMLTPSTSGSRRPGTGRAHILVILCSANTDIMHALYVITFLLLRCVTILHRGVSACFVLVSLCVC